MRRIGVWAAALVSGSLMFAGCDQSGGDKVPPPDKSHGPEMMKMMEAQRNMGKSGPPKASAPAESKPPAESK
jgi:hypothetical protein